MFDNIVGLLLGAAFVTFGTVLITPKISPEVHDQLVGQFNKKFTVHPLKTHDIIKDYTAEQFRTVFAVITITCGALILIGPFSMQRLVYLVMSVLLGLDVYCHVLLEHKAREIGPSMCFLFVTLMQLFTGPRYVEVKLKEQ